jgi:hypothetical protein
LAIEVAKCELAAQLVFEEKGLTHLDQGGGCITPLDEDLSLRLYVKQQNQKASPNLQASAGGLFIVSQQGQTIGRFGEGRAVAAA